MLRAAVWVTALALAGCGGAAIDAPETAAAASQAQEDGAPRDLPEYLARLGVSDAQLDQLDGIRDRMMERLAAADAQRLTFQDAILEAVDHCDPDYARMHIEAKRMIAAGNDAQPAVLDAINELHALLTPAQRKLLVEPMLERNEARKGEQDSEGFEALGDKLDLGVGQILELVARARTHLRLDRRGRDELREQFEQDAESFMSPDFDAHKSALGQQAITEIVVNLILDLGVVVLPVLDQRQCQALAAFGREQAALAEKKRLERAKERQARRAARAASEPPPLAP